MITHEEAYNTVMRSARKLGTEQVHINNAINRILAEDIASDMDMPPFNKSAMDGYACRKEDLGNALTIIESIQAGHAPTQRIGRNQCSKIMTGAVVPEGADCVIMVEYTDPVDSRTIHFTGQQTKENICYQGEDIQIGDIIARAGERITSRTIAILASVGCVTPPVAIRPRVGIIATGTEIVEPDTIPALSQVRNSNSYQLHAQVTAAGAVPLYFGIAEDTRDATDTLIRNALSKSDILLMSGGVSMGDYDLVPGILKENNFDLIFEKVAVKPGKPTVFGIHEKAYCFGLPGNPVSTFIIFDVFVKPFIYKLMGHDFQAPIAPFRLATSIHRRKSNRASWMPVCTDPSGTVSPVEYHGSAHIHSLCCANGLICIPMGVDTIEEGTLVDVRQILPED